MYEQCDCQTQDEGYESIDDARSTSGEHGNTEELQEVVREYEYRQVQMHEVAICTFCKKELVSQGSTLGPLVKCMVCEKFVHRHCVVYGGRERM